MNNTRKLALGGLFTALSVILVVVSTYINMSTLWLLLAGAFLCGYTGRLCGLLYGGASVAAVFLLSLILAAEKLRCFTFLGLALFIFLLEVLHYLSVREKPLPTVAAWILRMFFWSVFIAVALVAYNALVGDITAPVTELLKTELPHAAALILLILALEALGVIISLAYEAFIKTMSNLLQRTGTR